MIGFCVGFIIWAFLLSLAIWSSDEIDEEKTIAAAIVLMGSGVAWDYLIRAIFF